MLFAIPNLASHSVFRVEPWAFRPDIPASAMVDKAAFSAWCHHPLTRNCHFSACEGLDAQRRVAEENPVFQMHGFIADFDAETSPEVIQKFREHPRTEFGPSWGSLTFSRQGRLVWLFERPVMVPNKAVGIAFMKHVAAKLKVEKYLAGLDRKALVSPIQYYERGREWFDLGHAPVPVNVVHCWMAEAGNQIKWIPDGTLIPIETLAEQVRSQFPGRWKGAFEEGALGVRFWDPAADCPTGAIVRANGMQCFTGPVPFMPWAKVFGSAFVEKFEADRTGAIIADTFYDGLQFWKFIDKAWRPLSKDDFSRSLRTDYNLRSRPQEGSNHSEVDQVINTVVLRRYVTAALPFVHFPEGLTPIEGKVYLNTATARCIDPTSTVPARWGDGFPWLAEFLDGFFDPPEQKEFFLAWWKRFYANGHRRAPRPGQALFIAGPVGVGKTLLARGLVARSVGGFRDASDFLLGKSRFTSDVLGVPVMSVDDETDGSDPSRHAIYSAMVKKIVANRHQRYEEKFLKAGQVTWMGRIIVTCNLDAVSIRMLPNVELSMLDKVSLFHTTRQTRTFPEDHDIEVLISAELPAFCRWLLEWPVPEELRGTARFGVKSYHEDSLYNTSLQSSASYSFLELLLRFLEDYFVAEEARTTWEGTATDLMSQMRLDAGLGGIAAKYTPNQAASYLAQLKSRGYRIEQTRTATRRIWRIPKDLTNEPRSENAENETPAAAG